MGQIWRAGWDHSFLVYFLKLKRLNVGGPGVMGGVIEENDDQAGL